MKKNNGINVAYESDNNNDNKNNSNKNNKDKNNRHNHLS